MGKAHLPKLAGESSLSTGGDGHAARGVRVHATMCCWLLWVGSVSARTRARKSAEDRTSKNTCGVPPKLTHPPSCFTSSVVTTHKAPRASRLSPRRHRTPPNSQLTPCLITSSRGSDRQRRTELGACCTLGHRPMRLRTHGESVTSVWVRRFAAWSTCCC